MGISWIRRPMTTYSIYYSTDHRGNVSEPSVNISSRAVMGRHLKAPVIVLSQLLSDALGNHDPSASALFAAHGHWWTMCPWGLL